VNPVPWDDATTGPSETIIRGVTVRPGDRVRLRPTRRADIMDVVLDGMIATVSSIEQDFEGRIHLAVTVDDDPGRDLGEDKLIGHRFFFLTDEVEPFF
jgi:hypothetical protein